MATMGTTKIDPKTGKPYSGVSAKDARKAAGRAKKAARISPATPIFGMGMLEEHDRRDLTEDAVRDDDGNPNHDGKKWLLPG